MSGLALEEIAELLLRGARQHGATAADVVVAEGDSLTVGVRLGEVEKVQRARAKHLGLRAFVGERSAVLSTADFSRASLEQLAADAVALARVTAADPVQRPARRPRSWRTAIPELSTSTIRPCATSPPSRPPNGARPARRPRCEADPRITNSEGAEFDGGSHVVLYAASNGFQRFVPHLELLALRRAGRVAERHRWSATTGTACSAIWRALERPEDIGRTAAARALRRLGARKVETREVPVVFDPEMAGSLLRHLAGAVSGNALYKGMSFLTGKLGETIAPPSLHVVRRRHAAERARLQALRRRGPADAAHRR